MELLRNKKFLTLVVDGVLIAAIYYFGGKYLSEDIFEDVKFLVIAIQPVVALIINYIAVGEVKAEVREFRRMFRH